jgi:hypothetical protein
MFVTPSGPAALLNWFWHGRHSYRFLVLLAAGDVGQKAFFGEVFEQKENLDIVSGPEIAVFLFGGEPDSAVGIRGSGLGEILIIPGSGLGPGQRWSDADLRIVHVSELRPADRDAVILKSMTATSELCERLELDESHVPGLFSLRDFVNLFGRQPPCDGPKFSQEPKKISRRGSIVRLHHENIFVPQRSAKSVQQSV